LMPNKMYRRAHLTEYGADPFPDIASGYGAPPQGAVRLKEK